MMFSLDEEIASDHIYKASNNTSNTSSDDELDSFKTIANRNEKMSSAKFTPNASRQTPAEMSTATRQAHASLAMSLPVNITNSMYVRMDSFIDEREDDIFEEAVENNIGESESSEGNTVGRLHARTIISAREDQMYRNMRAYSRSIQPVDDPERLFGERPHRRHKPTELNEGGGSDSEDRARIILLANTRPARVACSLSTPTAANNLNLRSIAGQTDPLNAGDSDAGGETIACTQIIEPSSYAGPLL